MKKIVSLFLLTFVSSVLLSCSESSTGFDAGLRVLMAASTQKDVDVFVDDTFFVSSMAFGESTGFRSENDGYRLITVEDSSSGRVLLQYEAKLDRGKDYTFIFAGEEGSYEGFLVKDGKDTPNLERFELRFMNLVKSLGSLDIYVDRGNPPLNETTPREESLSYGSVSGYKDDKADDYKIRVTRAGGSSILVDSGYRSFSSREIATAYIVSRNNGSPKVIILSY